MLVVDLHFLPAKSGPHFSLCLSNIHQLPGLVPAIKMKTNYLSLTLQSKHDTPNFSTVVNLIPKNAKTQKMYTYILCMSPDVGFALIPRHANVIWIDNEVNLVPTLYAVKLSNSLPCV